ncbi:TRAP transporter fused permease subunit [Evansella sp. AB-P1]|uniref:TRAP transporter permease n=1 Tax=Evansella sp. AB-P1 TaxID=3037653 RepID=UPI00241E1177|nr:TRAP transporter fused permease subunit [Evansella sp. AB-P1]MDG5788856.1 TRAP transporter fused permease subunit [Evansella sp. AB-P1]
MNDLTKQQRKFSLEKVISVVAVIMAVSHLYIVFYMPIGQDMFKNLHIMFALVLFYLLQLLKKDQTVLSKAFTIVLLVMSLVVTVYVHFNFQQLYQLMGIMTLPLTIMGAMLMLVVWEASRRYWGWIIPIFVLFMLLYAYFGNLFPGALYHRGISVERIIGYSTMFMGGIYGRLTALSATLIFPLFVFAGLLSVLGGKDMFLRLGWLLADKFRSGPAQASVLTSMFMGSIVGSTTANVATTGSFTIPMMKSAGYRPHYAAGVESVASTGAQIMPPIMGSVAFVMVGLTSIPYFSIAIAALIPALLFYFYLSVSVELRANKEKVTPIDKKEDEKKDSVWKILKDYFHLLVAIGILVYLLSTGFPAGMSVVWTIVFMVGFSLIRYLIKYSFKWEGLKLLIKDVYSGLDQSARTGAPLFIFMALVGIAIEMMVTTGLAQKFSNLLIQISGGYFLPLLLLTALACLIFGMGMPSVSAYILVALLGAPALVDAGASLLSAHMFVFYVSILAAITPPLAINPMVASGIAKCDFWPAAMASVRLGLPAFILPFYFMYRPELLIHDYSVVAILLAVFFAFTALLALSIASEGYLFRHLSPIERVVLVALAILLLLPNTITSVIGVLLFLPLVAYIYNSNKKVPLMKAS